MSVTRDKVAHRHINSVPVLSDDMRESAAAPTPLLYLAALKTVHAQQVVV